MSETVSPNWEQEITSGEAMTIAEATIRAHEREPEQTLQNINDVLGAEGVLIAVNELPDQERWLLYQVYVAERSYEDIGKDEKVNQLAVIVETLLKEWDVAFYYNLLTKIRLAQGDSHTPE